MNFLRKALSFVMLTTVLATSLQSNQAKAATDPYAALASATIAVYATIAIGGTMAIAGLVWTTKKIASRDVAIQEAKDDAVIFLANDGEAPSLLLRTIFEKTREKLAETMSDEELSEFTDINLAEMLITGVDASMVIE